MWCGETRAGCWLVWLGYHGLLLTGLERKYRAFAVAVYLGSGRDFSRLTVQEIGVDAPKPWLKEKPDYVRDGRFLKNMLSCGMFTAAKTSMFRNFSDYVLARPMGDSGGRMTGRPDGAIAESRRIPQRSMSETSPHREGPRSSVSAGRPSASLTAGSTPPLQQRRARRLRATMPPQRIAGTPRVAGCQLQGPRPRPGAFAGLQRTEEIAKYCQHFRGRLGHVPV